jgi:hypothetical protein
MNNASLLQPALSGLVPAPRYHAVGSTEVCRTTSKADLKSVFKIPVLLYHKP